MIAGIISIDDPRKGLWRDAETLKWALSTNTSWFQSRVNATTFHVNYGLLGKQGLGVKGKVDRFLGEVYGAEEMSLDHFVNRCEVLVFFEIQAADLFQRILARKKRVIWVPNMDWAVPGGALNQIRKMKGLEVWIRRRTMLRGRFFQKARVMPWTVVDPVVTARQPPAKPLLYVNAGNGGYKGRRAVDTVLKAFHIAAQQAPELKLRIKSIKPLSEYLDFAVLGLLNERVEVIEGFRPREELDQYMQDVSAVVHVSRWEGFGYPALEALHAGVPVITHNGRPVGDDIEHLHNGLVVKAKQVGAFHSTPHWEVEPEDLAEAMTQICNQRLMRRLTCPEPAELIAKQHTFCLEAQGAILRKGQPVVNPGAGGHRRSELCWKDALESKQ